MLFFNIVYTDIIEMYGEVVYGACTYSETNTQWITTGNTRNKEYGTSCPDDGQYCTDDFCHNGFCIHPLGDRCGDGECNCGETSTTCQKDCGLPPTATDLKVSCSDYCSVTYPHLIFSWKFSDEDGDTQSAYQIKIIKSSTGEEIYDWMANSSSQKFATPPNLLEFDTNYYWQLKVWDSRGLESGWISGPATSTPKHPYPTPSFTFNPEIPFWEKPVQFSNQSICYDEDFENGQLCSTSSGDTFSWQFLPDGDPLTSTQENPVVLFQTPGEKTILFSVTDSDSFTCTTTQLFNALMGFPIWREISPAEF